MKLLLILITTLISNVAVMAQTVLSLPSDTIAKSDTVVMVKMRDVQLINLAFHQRQSLLQTVSTLDSTVSLLKNKISVQQSIILNKDKIIDNNSIIAEQYKSIQRSHESMINKYKADLKKERLQKSVFMIGGLISVGGLTAILLMR